MFTHLLREDEGALVVEYALIIAMISIGLVLALQPLLIGRSFSSFIARFVDCLTGACV